MKSAAKNQTGVTLKMNIKIFAGNNLPHDLLLTIIQKTKLKNPFKNNISNHIKFSKAQIYKVVQSGRLLGASLSKLLWQKIFYLH